MKYAPGRWYNDVATSDAEKKAACYRDKGKMRAAVAAPSTQAERFFAGTTGV
jgi:hypothetical protein